MKMKIKLILYIIGCLLVGVVSAILVITKISLPYIESEETKKIQSDIEKASLVLNSDMKVLERNLRDWTWWDETHNFAKGEAATYIDDNLGRVTIEQLNLVGMLFFDKNGNSIYSEYLNENDRNMVQNVIEQEEVIRDLFKEVDEKHTKSGITLINQKMFMVSSAGISTSDGSSPSNGYLIMVKEIDDEYISYLGKLLGASIQYHEGKDDESKVFAGISLVNITRNGKSVHYQGSTNDILNDYSIMIEADGNRVMYTNAVDTLKTVCVTLVIIFLIISFVTIILVEKREFSRISYITKFVQDVISKRDIKLRMVAQGKDEIASLANNINYMLEELESNTTMVEKNKEHLHLIMEATNDGYFDYNISNGMITINRAWLIYLGYHITNDTSLTMEQVLSGIVNDEREDFRKAMDECLHNDSEIFYREVRAYKAERGFIWVLVRGKVTECNKDGLPTQFVGSLSDITTRKEKERENIYLLQTDPVTNLKNRAFMENKIKEVADNKGTPYCVIMADVNGLKLMNDAFGHKEGDRLLNTVGEIIKICCSDTDVPVRWGGDEFLVLIQNNRQYANALVNKIRSELNQVHSFPIKISLAMGCSGLRDTDSEVEQVIHRAEEKMYRNKLLETRSFHNGVIASFSQTLFEKKIETPEKINRRRKLCQKMGELMNLSPEEVDELDLLSLLHDVGKISMSDHIIQGKEDLTLEEWKLRKEHVEYGYRIAKVIPEIAHIANSILCHHENFDGTGYPAGIEGEHIPLNSRIFSVISYYDNLIYGVNKKSMELEEVKQEIEKKAGKQFDPDVVHAFLKLLDTKF